MTNNDQYKLETTLSTRLVDDIVLKALQGDIPEEMEKSILGHVTNLNSHNFVDNKEIYIKLFSLVLKDKVARPVQATATRLGMSSGIKSAPHAFHWGWVLLKECIDSGLYNIGRSNDNLFVYPGYKLSYEVKHRLAKLQYLPPMKSRPLKWTNNHNGGWLWESKHLVLGNQFTKHDEPLAYDVINKLQNIAWEIDPDTYLFEKETNSAINRQQFLSVIDEYLGKHFYFVWRYDSRGRSYSSGYHLDLQTNEYGKALLSLHKKELITQLPNLYIAIANHAGKDKLTWKKRIDWVTKQDIDNIKWDKPILGRKALRALKDTCKGKPTGYVMSLDATSSGIQIMAVISGCRETAKYVNCINPNVRYDLYTEVAKMMNKKLKERLPRPIVKEITMTHFYNSEAEPKKLLTEKQLEVFYEVITGLLPGAEQVMQTINECWNSDADHHSWVMPDGHTVYVPIVESISNVYTDPKYGEIPLTWIQQNKSNNYRSLCPNVIHSIDGYIAREMVRKCKFQLYHVHDCFMFNPNYLQEVSKTYREIMAGIAKSDLFGNILRQITGNSSLKVTRTNNNLAVDILKSEYMLS
jgi:hypothetical protein